VAGVYARTMRLAPSLVVAALALSPATADAFCGFYVAGGDQKMFNDATQVVLMRSGTRTVLSMQNNYKGPPTDFAMVIPVPVVLHEGDVKTLTKEVFAQVEAMGAPRLVEYWEQDPCPVPQDPHMAMPSGVDMAMAGSGAVVTTETKPDLGVTIEAKFTVGEYQVVILSAKDSTGLDTWLRQENYKIPASAEPLLRPYVESGMKFFVAKVDPKKVTFVDGRAELSPLRFHYDTEDFSLPIRLGLANSSGTQDLIVNILAPMQRYEVANYKNVTIPTNLDVDAKVKDKFGAFYAALFDRTVEMNPGAVVTEYAWQATTCDPCPGPALDQSHFLTLGADVLGGSKDSVAPYHNADFVLTRLHARYGTSMKDDLRFKTATPIVGGRENRINGRLEERAANDQVNNFQGRYAIRYPWTGPIRCEKPVRGVWGGPPHDLYQKPGFQPPQVKPALDLAFAARGTVQLASAVLHDVPEIDVRVGASTVAVRPTPTPGGTPSGEWGTKKSGCGCQTTDRNGPLVGALLVGMLILRRRRGQ
jgi:MYXO-CTERM domain-containing protein